jgi:hypothetical protein
MTALHANTDILAEATRNRIHTLLQFYMLPLHPLLRPSSVPRPPLPIIVCPQLGISRGFLERNAVGRGCRESRPNAGAPRQYQYQLSGESNLQQEDSHTEDDTTKYRANPSSRWLGLVC